MTVGTGRRGWPETVTDAMTRFTRLVGFSTGIGMRCRLFTGGVHTQLHATPPHVHTTGINQTKSSETVQAAPSMVVQSNPGHINIAHTHTRRRATRGGECCNCVLLAFIMGFSLVEEERKKPVRGFINSLAKTLFLGDTTSLYPRQQDYGQNVSAREFLGV